MAKAAHAVSVAPVIAGQGVPTGFPAAVTSPGVSKLLDANDMKMPGGMQRYVDRQNVPIGFYGQVVDQDGNALAGVQIKVVIRHWILANPAVGLVGTKDVTLERVTGADGRFEITSETGDGFDLK